MCFEVTVSPPPPRRPFLFYFTSTLIQGKYPSYFRAVFLTIYVTMPKLIHYLRKSMTYFIKNKRNNTK